jgi:TM2 domain-containing membrane protein YozV
MKNKVIAAVLAILIGGIGIHRFYLGQWKLGLVYLLLSWTVVPLFIGVIDGILFLIMSEEKFNAKYNQ